MIILHIDETFHPEYGYHTSILCKYQAKTLTNRVYILTVDEKHLYPVYKSFGDFSYDLNKDKIYEQDNLKIIRIPTIGYYSGRAIYRKKIFEEINRIKPDVIYCHLVESLIAIKLILKDINYPIFFDSHMLSMASKNPLKKIYNFLYRKIVTKRIIKKNYLVIKTQDDNYITDVLGIPENQTKFISFGTNTSLFKKNLEVKALMREKLGINQNDFVVIYTGKLNADKGGPFLADAIRKKILLKNKNIVFILVGYATEEIKRKFEKSQNRIIFIERQKYVDLNKYYQTADLSIFPKQCSLSFYDAQACGLPVVSEDNNVNIDRLKFDNGKTFRSGDASDFVKQIKYFGNCTDKELEFYSNNSINYILNNYSYDLIVKQYNEIIEKVINDFNEKKTNIIR